MPELLQPESAKLLALDFDNTYALTFDPSPTGMTVQKSYEIAVDRVLGRDALHAYMAFGGLRNRGPTEVVAELLPGADPQLIDKKTEDLIEAKLAQSMRDIGQKLPDGNFWPRLSEGFRPVWEQIAGIKQINTAVVTSGHREFIRRVHDVHEIAYPDIVVADEDMRPLTQYLPAELCAKPSRNLLRIAHMRWQLLHDHHMVSSENMVYAGDDSVKDGQMASNYGVAFVLIDQTRAAESWQQVESSLSLAAPPNAA
jgi:hypothetical protein